jgi:hypothetical protein
MTSWAPHTSFSFADVWEIAANTLGHAPRPFPTRDIETGQTDIFRCIAVELC